MTPPPSGRGPRPAGLTKPAAPDKPSPPAKPAGLLQLGSLQRRLLLAALAFVTLALVVAGLAIGVILHRFVRAQLDSRLDSQLVAIAASLERGPGERLRLDRTLDGPPFDRPRSGWYWQVRQGRTTLRADSLEGRDLPVPDRPAHDPDPDRVLPGDATGPWGDALILRTRVLPAEAGRPPVILVASAPAQALNGPLREAGRALAAILGILGLCLVAGTVAQVRLGLRPLERLRRDIAEVRAGRRPRIPGQQPAEIRPLVTEVNALLDQNAANLERARTHVANLAHGLKTPLATLTLALSDRTRDPDGRLAALVAAMDRQVRHHLRRARTAALGGATRARTDLAGPLSDLRTTFGRLYAEKTLVIDLDLPEGLAAACDPQDIDEMLGNLIDNACQWSRGRVRIAGRPAEAGVTLTVEDDGPGLDAAAAARAIRPGGRLDESVPGHGFGLSITTELAELYGGGLQLGRSDLGGLSARLQLPA
ncbi:HAMP domain-containing sensor histidine kinase [Methylobacterium sp. 37f]|uniref:sensor histidine kinase n=1 Tax=Methylobacterium sp. 37f TaxID=2817058 RepID=UPI001FFCDB77|nr:HAMP domain-containing sensor histidine kinase [Methylobacterium sp. 37f]MCK2056200.1 HAMP domain-containing histidine kinase [Methylobacterium sp. 37f]